MNFAYQPYDPPDYQRDQVIGAATLPESDVLSQDASDALFGAEREGGAYIASKIAGTEIGAASRGPGQDEYIDPHTLNQNYSESLGLTFDQPMRRAQADILVQQKKAQLQRDYVAAHAPGGFWNTTANYGTQLAVSAADPLNVAAAFIPVVGETRAALWAERYGPTLARAGEGAAGGGTAAAALQPLSYLHAQEFQDDYTPMDAFMNVAVGSILGGGLHAGLGKVSDMLGGMHPDTREAALRGSVAQMAEGRPVDASATIASDPAGDEFDRMAAAPAAQPVDTQPLAPVGEETLPQEATPEPSAVASKEDIAQAAADLKTVYANAPSDTNIAQAIRSHGGLRTRDGEGNLTSEGGDIMQVIGDNPGHVMNLVNNNRGIGGSAAKGQPLDNMTTILKSEGWLHPDAEQGDLLDAIDEHVRGNPTYHPGSDIHVKLAHRQILSDEVDAAGIRGDEPRDQQARMLAEFRANNGREFALSQQEGIGALEGTLSSKAQEVLHADDDWIGSDEWVRSEAAGAPGGDAAQAQGVPAADEGPIPQSAGSGGDATARGQAEGAGGLRGQFDDALSRARTAQNDFTQNREPSTLVPPGVSEAAEREVASGKGDNIDEELAEAERTVADYQRNGVISDDDLAAMKEANAADAETATTRGDAAKAASTCLWLHP